MVYNVFMWTIDQIQTFKLVADLGNFSKAANQLAISTAAVGKQIKMLEKSLGAELFYRTTRRVTLTEFGESFYEQCQAILSEVEKTNDLVATFQGKVSGKLKIISGVTFGKNYVVSLITEFLTLAPLLSIEFELADRIPDLEKENIDIAIGLMEGLLPSHYMCRRLMYDRHLFCASPEYLEKNGMPLEPEDLKEHNFITHSKRLHPNLIYFNNDIKVSVKPRLEINNTDALLQSCLSGFGIAMLSAKMVDSYLKSKQLTEALQEYRQPEKAIYIYFKKMEYMQPKVRAFIDFMMKVFNQ